MAENRAKQTDFSREFYDAMASQYDKLFLNWKESSNRQAEVIRTLIGKNGLDMNARILDCACGIGTQAIGLAALGFPVTASDISACELAEARQRAAEQQVEIRFEQADFCALSEVFSEQFDIVLAMDNALPHMLSEETLGQAVKSMTERVAPGGIFMASIRDYDQMLLEKPAHSAPYVHQTEGERKISFQLWDWEVDHYKFTQYIIEDDGNPKISRFDCEYRAVRREELTRLLLANGCSEVRWAMPEETGFYQPIVIAQK